MTMEILTPTFTVAKVNADTPIPRGEFVFFSRTDTENSLLCPTDILPEGIASREDGWRGMRIAGTLDFSLIGILSRISTVLAEANIGIFALSTFDTDYIFVKAAQLSQAMDALRAAGYTIADKSYQSSRGYGRF